MSMTLFDSFFISIILKERIKDKIQSPGLFLFLSFLIFLNNTMLLILNCLLLFIIIVQQTIAELSWSVTPNNCLWHKYAPNNRLIHRIDLRDLRNQIFKYVWFLLFSAVLIINLSIDSISLNDSIYYFNPCKTFNYPIGDDPHTADGEQCHNVLGCKRIQKSVNHDEYYTVAIKLNSTIVSKGIPLIIRYHGIKYD